MLRRGSAVGVAGILLLASAVLSQPPGGPGRGFGGPGGFQATPRTLLAIAEVCKELGISDDQKKQIDHLLAEVQRQMQASFGRMNFEDLQKLSPEERQKRFEEARKTSEEAGRKADEKLEAILNAKQRARLSQLRIQREGLAAFNRPEIVRQLGLTDDQRDKLRRIQEQSFGPFAGGPQTQVKALADARAVLTDAQKAQWDELKGKEFKFPQQPGFGGFGPGGMLGQKHPLVKQFDKNGDGWLNASERQAARTSLKKERESNSRGGFPPGGFGPGGPGRFQPTDMFTKPLLQALDTNKDGKVTKAEVTAGVKQFYEAADKDKKGALDEARFTEGLVRISPSPPRFPDGPGGGPGGPPGNPPGPPGGFGPGRFLGGAVFRRADANKDGKVTLEEALAAAAALFQESDKNKDGSLDEAELGTGLGQLMPAPPFGFGGRGNREPPKPGPHLTPADVKVYPGADLYEPTILRTLFLDFENKDWEAELEDFHGTDVEVPATLTVDGKRYPNVGVRFRGMSSYGGVRAGYKRSLNVSLDLADNKQRLHGYKTLNLLNSHEDPSFLSTVLYSHVTRQHAPAPKANFVKVVINGESWGVYVNAQQFNKEFVKENYHTTKGARWKVRGSPGGRGGLEYIGENIDDYKRRFEIKSADDVKSWKALISLCRTLNETPPDKLEAALIPILDLDGLLWFLAVDVTLINGDGYWIRASDYSLYRDPKGVFHVIPHDMNETFRPAGGPGFGPGGFGGRPGAAARSPVELDPLIGLDDPRKPLRSKVLAVPSLRQRYLRYVHAIADEWLDWKKLGPIVAQYRALLEKEIEADTRKLDSLTEFRKMTSDAIEPPEPGDRPGRNLSLRAFAEQRRQYLLNHPEVKKAVTTN